MKNISLCLFLLITNYLSAQDYNVLLIPDSLTKNANAVKRMEETRVVIKSAGKAIVHHKYAVTVLNEEGDDYAVYINSYDKLHDLSDISGDLYDAMGKKLKSVKKKDISDVSYNDQMSLVTDDRIKRHNFFYRQYPYTVEYEDELELDGIFFLPHWDPVDDENYSVQQSSLIIEAPADYDIRFKQFNYAGQPVIANDGSKKTYTWVLKNYKALKHEIFQPSSVEITPNVYIAPVNFSISGYSGSMDTWQNLGKFILTLNSGRDVLPDKVKQDIHALTDTIKDQKEKIKKLYNYLQNNTRYISVQLGIGSWQPFDAKYVATNRYGDCKALSNYMVSILKEAGIKANYVLVKAGDRVSNGLWDDFPAPYFNHAIACIPQGKDTMWLECTSQDNPAGYMGSFTGNREVLLVGDDGGHVVNTPIYTSKENLQLRKINAVIDAEGNLGADLNTHLTGIQQELQHALIHNATKEERDKYLNNTLNLATYSVDKSSYKENEDVLPSVDEYLHITSQGYATVTGKRMFIQPDLFNKSTTKLNKDEERKFDIVYPNAFKDVDTISITVPDGYTPEAIPSNVSINDKFGNYNISFTVNGNKIDVLRVNIRDKARYPPSDYLELVKHYDDIYKADRSRIVLVKKDE